MSGRKISLTLILAASLLLPLVLWGLWFVFASKLNPGSIQRMVIRTLEERTDGTVTFEGFRFSYFPFPRAEFRDVQFEWRDSKKILMKAHQAKIIFRILPFLWGRTDAGKIEIEGGQLSFLMSGNGFLPRLDVNNIALRIHSVGAKIPMAIEFKGDFAGLPKSISGQASCTLEGLAGRDWGHAEADGSVQIRDVDLTRIGPGLASFPWKVRAGRAGGDFHFKKMKNDPNLMLESDLSLKGFVYQTESGANLLISPEINLALNSRLEWDPKEEEIYLKTAVLDSPMGKIEAGGRFLGRTGELQEVRMRASDLLLETIPQDWIFLKEAIPLNLGFSGQGSLEMSLEGTLDHLWIHANVDFTKTLLTYGRFFSKAKDIPMNLGLDYLIKDGKILSGDFSLRFLEARLKGAVTGFDLETGQGSINMITNKFPLAGWQAVMPPFSDYQLGGEMKILASMTGSYLDRKALQPVLNITVENGRLSRTPGTGISDLKLSLDYGPVAFEIREADFQVNGAAIKSGLMVYNPTSHPAAKAHIEAPHLEFSKIFSGVEELSGTALSADWQKGFDRIKNFLLALFPQGQAVDNFSAQFGYEDKDKKFSLENMRFEAYQGEVQLHGALVETSGGPAWSLETEINRLSLSRFLARREGEEKIMEGNLFLDAAFHGKNLPDENWPSTVTGEGSFSVTNGEFQSLDLLAGPAALDPLRVLGPYTSGKTAFDDIRGRFSFKDGKISTQKAMLFSKDLLVQAHGELYLDGLSNYRLDIFLSPALTDAVVAPILGKSEVEGDKQFGPLPFLLSGPLSHPELKPDPVLIPQMLDLLAKRRTQKIFRHFLPEDFFFERRKSS